MLQSHEFESQLTLDFGAAGKISPVKIDVLRQVAMTGSISAAARALGITYKHAWESIDDLNRIFGVAMIEGRSGGRRGGGSQLTAEGRIIVARLGELSREVSTLSKRTMRGASRSLAAAGTRVLNSSSGNEPK